MWLNNQNSASPTITQNWRMWCVSQQENDIQKFPPTLEFQVGCLTPMSLLHLAWASAVTFREWVELLPVCRSAKLSLAQRTVTHSQLYITAKTVLYAIISFTSAAPLASIFLLSLLTSLHPPHHLSYIRWDGVWSFSLLSPRQGIVSVRGLRTCNGGQCQRLVRSSSLLDLPFPPPVTLSLRWSGVHLLSVCASAFPTHTRTSHYATSSSRVQTKWNTSCVRQMDFLR